MSDNQETNLDRCLQDASLESSILPLPVSDEQWQAVSTNDASYDGTFFYAVRTTGIFFVALLASQGCPKEKTLVALNMPIKQWPPIIVPANAAIRQDSACPMRNGLHW